MWVRRSHYHRPSWQRGPQVRASGRHAGHGVIDVSEPVALPDRDLDLVARRPGAGVWAVSSIDAGMPSRLRPASRDNPANGARASRRPGSLATAAASARNIVRSLSSGRQLRHGVLVQDSHRSPDSTADIASETPTPGIFKASTASVPAAVLGTLAVLAVSAIVGAWRNLSARTQRSRSSAVAPEGAMRSEGGALRGGDRLQALPILVYA